MAKGDGEKQTTAAVLLQGFYCGPQARGVPLGESEQGKLFRIANKRRVNFLLETHRQALYLKVRMLALGVRSCLYLCKTGLTELRTNLTIGSFYAE